MQTHLTKTRIYYYYSFFQTMSMLAHQEKLTCFGRRIPHYFWFVLSGALCDIVQAGIDYCVYLFYKLEWERATVCWAISYSVSIIVRHMSHRFIVFGEYEGTYCSSLLKTYMTYSSSIVISVISNHYIVEYFRFSHRDAWVVTMLWTGIYNYFMLKSTWKSSKAKESAKEFMGDSESLLGTKSIALD